MKVSKVTVSAIGLFASTVVAAHAEMTNNLIKIGVLNDQSSVYADAAGPGSVVAARLAVEDMGGNVNGTPIEVIFADHQNKPDVGAQIARRWYQNENVDVIVDYGNSAVALAVQNLTKELKKVSLPTSVGTRRITGDACSPYTVHWTYDSYALASTTAQSVTADGGNKWYFITVDYALGHSLEQDSAEIVKKNGGEVLGAARHPLGTTDFSSFLLTAQGSGANVLGLANNGSDAINAIKQAREYKLPEQGVKLAGLFLNFSDIGPIGLDLAQGILIAQAFYWDQDDASRAFSERFEKIHGAKPTMTQAGVYSAVLHYLKAIKAIGSDDAKSVVDKMKSTPVDDFFAKGGRIREDGRTMFDISLYRIKSPAQSKYPGDYLELVRTIPGEEAYFPIERSECDFIKNK
jgi:branched-chain amino acid transport system substrate-binding protein